MIIWTSDCQCSDCTDAIKALRANIYTKTYTDDEFKKLLQDNQLTYFTDTDIPQKESTK